MQSQGTRWYLEKAAYEKQHSLKKKLGKVAKDVLALRKVPKEPKERQRKVTYPHQSELCDQF